MKATQRRRGSRAAPHWLLVYALLLPTGFFCATLTWAQRSDPDLEARALFRVALTHAQSGAWADALKAFERAYQLAPRPAVLFNLAGAQLRAGRMLQAAANYTRFLHLEEASIGAVHRTVAQQQLTWIEANVPRLRVSVNGLTKDDQLTLDDHPIHPDELEFEHWVDPGAHEIRLVRPNGHEEKHRVVLAEAEHRVLLLTLP